MSVLSRSVSIRVGWALVVLAGLYVLGTGLGRSFSIEPTQEALASARVGVGMVYAASLVLVGAAAGAVRLGGPRWVGVAVALPALLCGGLTVVAGGTLFPLVSAALAYPVAVGGVVVGLFLRAPRSGMVVPWGTTGTSRRGSASAPSAPDEARTRSSRTASRCSRARRIPS